MDTLTVNTAQTRVPRNDRGDTCMRTYVYNMAHGRVCQVDGTGTLRGWLPILVDGPGLGSNRVESCLTR